jgi:hypothetical protein
MKVVHFLVFDGAGHTPKVCHVPYGLEVSTAEQKRHFDSLPLLDTFDDFVDLVDLAVTTADHCDMHDCNGSEEDTASRPILTTAIPSTRIRRWASQSLKAVSSSQLQHTNNIERM